jgi:hypothetical protein
MSHGGRVYETVNGSPKCLLGFLIQASLAQHVFASEGLGVKCPQLGNARSASQFKTSSQGELNSR